MPRFDLTVGQLAHVVLGLTMVPDAAALHRQLAARLHLETVLPIEPGIRRVTWMSVRDGVETWVEFYSERECDRIDKAVERAQQPRRPHRRTQRRR